jgi:hypothetical protein
VLQRCITEILGRRVQDDADRRRQAIMVLKETKSNKTLAVEASRAKAASRRTQKKGSRVTEERAKAQRAKLDAQAEARPGQEEQEVTVHPAQNKKTSRQEALAKRRVIETLMKPTSRITSGAIIVRKRWNGIG